MATPEGREPEPESDPGVPVSDLRHKDSVAFFGLTLEGLLERTVMPDKDKDILTRLMMDRLALPSAGVELAEML